MSRKEICILAIPVMLIIAAVITLVGVRANRQPDTVAGTFTPPAFDSSAVDGMPEETAVAGLPYGTLTLTQDIAVSLISQMSVNPDGQVDVWFTSHKDNTAWVRLRLMDAEGSTLGQTDLLRPGQYVQSITLGTIPEQSGVAQVKILTYEPDTYYSLGTAGAQVVLNISN